MSNEAPETREGMMAFFRNAMDRDHPVVANWYSDLVWSWLTTAREQGRAEALADVTEGEWWDATEAAAIAHPGWRGVANFVLASRRRPVAAAGNEEWDRSG